MARTPTLIALVSIHGLIRGHNLELGRNADTGGQTKYVVELAAELGQCTGVERVDLLTRLIDDPDYASDYAAPLEEFGEGARIVRLGCGPQGYVRKELLYPHLDEYVERAVRFYEEAGRPPDVVHGHYADGAYVAQRLAARFSVPFLYTGHSLGRNKVAALAKAGMSEEEMREQYAMPTRIAIEEEALRTADLVIASTRYEIETGYELYDAHREARYRVVPPGIDLERFRFDRAGRARLRADWGIGDAEILVGTVGRRVREKGLAEFATVASALEDRAHFVWVGPEDETEALTAGATDLSAVRFIPEQTDMPAVYSAFDLFVLASHREGFSRASMEAAACGRPMVLTDIRGCREIGSHGEHLLLAPPRDGSALAEVVTTLLADPGLRSRLGHAARTRATDWFDQRFVAGVSLETYAALMAKRPSRRPGILSPNSHRRRVRPRERQAA